MRRGTTTCSMSCWQVWTTGTNRSSTCKEPRRITTWTKYITHQWTQTTLTSVFFLIIFSLALFLLYMSHLVFLSRVVSVNWRGSKTSKTSSFWFSALRPSVCMLIRSPPSGPSSPLSCSLATCASAHMRCVCVKERERVRITPISLWYHTSLGVFRFRVSRLRWLVSSAKPRPGGLAVCCRFPPRHCRPSSLTESQSVASRAPVIIPYFCTCASWLAFSSSGDDLWQDLLPSVCGKCHRI